jgi:hypothetical protein
MKAGNVKLVVSAGIFSADVQSFKIVTRLQTLKTGN